MDQARTYCGKLKVKVLEARLQHEKITNQDVYITFSTMYHTFRTTTVKQGGKAPKWEKGKHFEVDRQYKGESMHIQVFVMEDGQPKLFGDDLIKARSLCFVDWFDDWYEFTQMGKVVGQVKLQTIYEINEDLLEEMTEEMRMQNNQRAPVMGLFDQESQQQPQVMNMQPNQQFQQAPQVVYVQQQPQYVDAQGRPLQMAPQQQMLYNAQGQAVMVAPNQGQQPMQVQGQQPMYVQGQPMPNQGQQPGQNMGGAQPQAYFNAQGQPVLMMPNQGQPGQQQQVTPGQQPIQRQMTDTTQYAGMGQF